MEASTKIEALENVVSKKPKKTQPNNFGLNEFEKEKNQTKPNLN
jgi:hypothetical protein